ncbi:MAG: hypothetical protein RIT45_2697 [Pseudomonadota bacterium]|jgi:hypothetical protein
MKWTRRRLLGAGIGGSVLLALGGLAMRRSDATRPAPTTLVVLSPRAWQVLAAVADRVCPSGDGWPSADTIDVASRVDALLGRMHPATAAEIEQVLGLLDNALGGLLMDGRTSTFVDAGPEGQDAILRDWQTSRIALRRAGYKALSGLCASAYYADPRVFPKVGYPGPPNYGNVAPAPGGAG